MGSIVKNKVGKYTYIYESVSYRDENGKPQTKKTPIGKYDLITGQPIYRPEYLERVHGTAEQPELSDERTFTVAEIKTSEILERGVFVLLSGIAKQTGLEKVVKEAFPSHWEQILSLAYFVVATGEPAMYCEDWITKNESYDCGSMSSQRISELLIRITNSERMDFYEKWGNYRNEQEFFALDITSVSSYSEFINDVEWGYNRDKEKLPQINVCMLLGEESKLPVFQMVYSGSLSDVSTLKTTLKTASGLNLNNLSIVMDKAFCSTKNITAMCSKDEPVRFLTAMPFTHSFARNQVESEKKDIDRVDNTIIVGDDIFRGITKQRVWKKGITLFAHSFLNVTHAEHAKNRLYGHVTALKNAAVKNPEESLKSPEACKYLIIRKSGENSYTVNIRYDVVDSELATAGWLICVSNHIKTAQEAIEMYRAKDVVEKGFARLKNCLDCARLRVHSDMAMQNKIFIGFIALILTAHIHKVMLENDLYKTMSMKKLLKSLECLRVQLIKDNRILFPTTKLQNGILEAFKCL